MGYRKDKDVEWREWLKLHANKLAELGLPEELYRSKSRWWYFLEHGYDFKTKWDPNEPSAESASKLVEFLENEYRNDEAWACIMDIKKK